MFYILILLLTVTFILPIISKRVERNLEIFLFFIGLAAAITSGALNTEFISYVFQNKLMYALTFAVLIGGFIFRALALHIKGMLAYILKHVQLRIFVFLLIVIVGLLSSVITAIISALLLVEIVSLLPVSRKNKINIDIIACFSIGLGAALTPIGEPLATIVISRLHQDFWFLMKEFGIFIIPGILILGTTGTLFAKQEKIKTVNAEEIIVEETNKGIIIRAFKIFLFIIALEMLGEGFKPIIDAYIIPLDINYLYWVNMSSAVLDNATLAAAELSDKMTILQIKAVLMGLLISGGIMIPGNIPNIITAGKLKIKSKEWIKTGAAVGITLMIVYYIILFLI